MQPLSVAIACTLTQYALYLGGTESAVTTHSTLGLYQTTFLPAAYGIR